MNQVQLVDNESDDNRVHMYDWQKKFSDMFMYISATQMWTWLAVSVEIGISFIGHPWHSMHFCAVFQNTNSS